MRGLYIWGDFIFGGIYIWDGSLQFECGYDKMWLWGVRSQCRCFFSKQNKREKNDAWESELLCYVFMLSHLLGTSAQKKVPTRAQSRRHRDGRHRVHKENSAEFPLQRRLWFRFESVSMRSAIGQSNYISLWCSFRSPQSMTFVNHECHVKGFKSTEVGPETRETLWKPDASPSE